MNFLNWNNFDEKMKGRAIEELLRFMSLFTSAAALVCFGAAFVQGGSMIFPVVFLTFMLICTFGWFYVQHKNEKRWGRARSKGREVFRIGMTQPTAEEKRGVQEPSEKKEKKKKKPVKKGNYRH